MVDNSTLIDLPIELPVFSSCHAAFFEPMSGNDGDSGAHDPNFIRDAKLQNLIYTQSLLFRHTPGRRRRREVETICPVFREK